MWTQTRTSNKRKSDEKFEKSKNIVNSDRWPNMSNEHLIEIAFLIIIYAYRSVSVS